jgi:hypothetical protein
MDPTLPAIRLNTYGPFPRAAVYLQTCPCGQVEGPEILICDQPLDTDPAHTANTIGRYLNVSSIRERLDR